MEMPGCVWSFRAHPLLPTMELSWLCLIGNEPSTLLQLIKTTFNLDQFEIQSGTITQKSDTEWNHVLEDEEIYNKPFGEDVAFFPHLHRETGPGISSFDLRLPQKEKVWDRFEVWADSNKTSKVFNETGTREPNHIYGRDDKLLWDRTSKLCERCLLTGFWIEGKCSITRYS